MEVLQVLFVVFQPLLQVLDVIDLRFASEAVDGRLEAAEVGRVKVFAGLRGLHSLFGFRRLLQKIKQRHFEISK